MKIKDGVNIQGINIKVRPILIAADKIWKKYGQELVVTSGMDGTHSAGSLHYYGLALDLRTRYFNAVTKEKVVKKLQEVLGCDYDVISHHSHIHVEYDPANSQRNF